MGANVWGDVDRESTAALELRFVPGAMPEMQNFNCSAVLVQPVVDVERRVEKPSELRMFFYGSADVRKGLKQFDAIEGDASPLTSRKFLPDRLTRLRGRGF